MKKNVEIVVILFLLSGICFTSFLIYNTIQQRKQYNLATDIKVIEENINLKAGEERNINAEIYPLDAINKELSYIVADNKIINVDDNGVIKGLKEGKTKVTIKSTNGITKTINITVNKEVKNNQEVKIKDGNITLIEGQEKKLTLIKSSNDLKIVWECDNEEILSCNDGNIKAIKKGTANVTAKCQNNNCSSTIKVTVDDNTKIVEENDISIDKNEITIHVNEAIIINAKVLPLNATYQDITYKSMDNQIATADDGVIKGIKVGTVEIELTTSYKKITKIIKVNVINNTEKLVDYPASIAINKSEITINKGEKEKLIATLSPTNIKNNNISWISSDSNIVTVNNGEITGIREGSATISAITANKKVANCKVTVKYVEVLPSKIELDKTSLTLTVNEETTLKGTISPTNANNKVIKWTSSNTKVATVDANGHVKALATGTTTITAQTSNNKQAKCEITVKAKEILPSKIELDKTSLTLTVNEETTLKGTISPTNANNKVIKWTSSNTKVATVDANGHVKALATGTATITAQTSNNKQAKCEITVITYQIPIKTITLNKTSLTLEYGNSEVLTAKISPANSDEKTTWKSTNSKIASVDNNGKVTATGVGTTTITITSNSGKKARCTVTVNPYLSVKKYPYIYQDETAKIDIEKKTYVSPITNKKTVYYLAHLVITDYSRLHTSINDNGNSNETSCNKIVYNYDTKTNQSQKVGKNCGLVSKAASNNGAIFAVEGDYSLNGGHSCNKIKGSIRDGKYYYVDGNAVDLSTINASGIGYGFYSKKTGIMGSTKDLKSANAFQTVNTKEATDSFCFSDNLVVNGKISTSSYMSSDAHRQANFVGYKGPGDFYFVVSEGAAYSNSTAPSDGISYGLVPKDRAQILLDLGCSFGAQLDGGGSVIVWFYGKQLQSRIEIKNERDWLTDFVYFK